LVLSGHSWQGLSKKTVFGIVNEALSTVNQSGKPVIGMSVYMSLHQTVPPSARLLVKASILSVSEEEARVEIEEAITFLESGEKLATIVSTLFVTPPGQDITSASPPPQRKPDFVLREKLSFFSSALHRLSGEFGRLDTSKPAVSNLGLLGIATKAVIKNSNNDSHSVETLTALFGNGLAAPGNTLITKIWKDKNDIFFVCKIRETGNIVLSSVLKIGTGVQVPTELKSAIIFRIIEKTIKADPTVIEKVGAIFRFNLTASNGEVVSYTVDAKNADTCGVVKGKVGKPDCTLAMKDEDYFDLATGKLKPMTAFSQGKIKVTGNLMLAQKLTTLTKAPAKL